MTCKHDIMMQDLGQKHGMNYTVSLNAYSKFDMEKYDAFDKLTNKYRKQSRKCDEEGIAKTIEEFKNILSY